MAEPSTLNCGFIIPNTGDLPGTWGSTAINPDLVAVDGYFGGVQSIPIVSGGNMLLTSPSGFIPTPSGGPTQAQNAVLRFTGAITADTLVILPIPGHYIIENLTTGTGNFVLFFRALNFPSGGNQICIEQGACQHIYNDGTFVRYVNLGVIGKVEMWAGQTAMPRWVTACTNAPYLLCDGTIYFISSYPFLGAKFGSQFGGNGTTTFGVPDLRGRMAIPYDGTGLRITAAGCGINGQLIGSAVDMQSVTLSAAQIPAISSVGSASVTVNSTTGAVLQSNAIALVAGLAAGGNAVQVFPSNTSQQVGTITSVGSGPAGVNSNNTGGQLHTNVQPSQVTGIAVIRAA